jgi:surface protein
MYNFNLPLNEWNVSKATNMQAMFQNAMSFNQPLEGWDTSNVTDMAYMFWSARCFNQPLKSWKTSKVTNMAGMFYDAQPFNQCLEGWDTSQVTSMKTIFGGTALERVCMNNPDHLKNWRWDTSKIEDIWYYPGFVMHPEFVPPQSPFRNQQQQ